MCTPLRMRGEGRVASRRLAVIGALAVLVQCTDAGPGPAGIHKIRHVVVIMQENVSFDHYFGTYPVADGIPMRDGRPPPAIPIPAPQSA